MNLLPFVLAPALLALPDRPIELKTEKSWIGKTVYPTKSGIYLDMAAEPNANAVKGSGPLLNMISYRVYAERPQFVQVKTREGQTGWLRKADLVPLEDAVAHFTKQIEANPRDINGYNRRGAAWRAKGELDAALKDATEALRLAPSAPLYNNRALIYQAKKEWDKALNDYAEAFRLNAQYPLCLVNRATMWLAKKDYDNAIADCTQAIQFQPQFPNAYRQRGLAHHAKKDYDKAITDFDRSLAMDPKTAQVHVDRGNVWAAKQEHAKALADYDEALRLEPRTVSYLATAALWLASCADAKFRDGKRALELARKAHALERHNSLALQALAAALAETGEFAEAVRWQEHALNDLRLQNDKTARARLELYRKMQPYRQGGEMR
jgi:tetratricopeptide (TPR) repeat protein